MIQRNFQYWSTWTTCAAGKGFYREWFQILSGVVPVVLAGLLSTEMLRITRLEDISSIRVPLLSRLATLNMKRSSDEGCPLLLSLFSSLLIIWQLISWTVLEVRLGSIGWLSMLHLIKFLIGSGWWFLWRAVAFKMLLLIYSPPPPPSVDVCD